MELALPLTHTAFNLPNSDEIWPRITRKSRI